MRRACALAARTMSDTSAAAAPRAPQHPKKAASAAAALSTSAPAAAAAANDNAPPGAAWLRGLVDHERQGVPDGAGDPASARKFDLAPMRALLSGIGDPQAAIPAVAHVAGTKGKGSVCAVLSAALRAARWRVGTYSSPHLLSASERAVVGGGGGGDGGGGPPRPMPAERQERLAQRAEAAAAASAAAPPIVLSHFEASTAVALRWFADERVDAAVVECGVGGETDATNVFLPPADGAGLAGAGSSPPPPPPPTAQKLVAVLTPVGRDHLAALGGSVAAAARAKAGIFRRGRPAVVAAQPDAEARAALREAVARSGARPVLFLGGGGCGEPSALDIRVEAAGPVELLPPPPQSSDPSQQQRLKMFKHLASQAVRVVLSGADADTPANTISPRSLALLRELEASTRASPIRMRLVGAHQRANAAAAIAAAALMAGDEEEDGKDKAAAAAVDGTTARPRLDAAAVAQGLADAFLPGRFQVLGLPPAGPETAAASAAERRRYLILDCAHTPESAEALALTARAALEEARAAAGGSASAASRGAGTAAAGPSSPSSDDADAPPIVLVLAMADDKPHRDVCAQLLYALRPRAVIFTSVPIAGGRVRAASPTTLAAQWQAAAMLPPPPSGAAAAGAAGSSGPSAARSDRPPRCREYIQASLKAALQKARRELETALAIDGGEGGSGGGAGIGAVVVAGSNHAVAAALRDLGVEDIVEQLE